MERNTYREVFAMLNAEREAAEAALDAVRRLKAQIMADEQAAMQRLNASVRRVRELEAKYDK